MTQGLAEQDPLVGKLVAGKFKIIKLLGEGGMGCVYQAEQQLGSTARKVAVKTLHKHLSQDAHIQARFEREAGTVAALEHPNTIQVFDFGKMDDGTLYIAMEFVQGKSVGEILEKEGAMPPARVENIMRQVCGSLEEAHGHGIIHRDLKPDNVVLCERAGKKDWVEVLDFGIAKRSSEHDPNEAKLTQQGMVLGTPPYMSPEQFTGLPIDSRSDIYALGVMCYEMLTGKLPFEANTAWEWASKHMTEVPTPMEQHPLGPNVPPNMRAAIMRALSKTKEERFATVTEFFDAFSASAAHVEAPPVSMANPAPGRAKTEMAQPIMGGGPPPGVVTPAFVPAVSAPAPSPPIVVPQGPAHSGKEKSAGGNGLVIGLAALAVLLIAGGGIAYVVSKKKHETPIVTTDPTSTASTGVTADSSGSGPTPDQSVTGATPLGGPSAPVLKAGTSSGGPVAVKDAGAAKPIPTPVIKPEPKPDPPECKPLRAARASGNKSPVIIASLEAKCRSAGGTP